jgi:methyl-accepting chemotaxis protein
MRPRAANELKNSRNKMMLAKRSIRAKIVAALSLLLTAAAAMGVFAIVQMQAINDEAKDIQANWLPSIRLLGELRVNTIGYRVAVRSHVLASDAAGKAAAENAMASIARDIDKTRKAFEAHVTGAEERAAYDEFSRLWNSYVDTVQELLEVSRRNDINGSLDLNNTKANPIGMKADEALKKEVDLNDRGAEQAGREAGDHYASAFEMVAAILACAILLGIAIGFYLVRDISRAIASIVAPMRALVRGDLAATVPHQGENTEIGAIADTVQMFKDELVAKKAAAEAAAIDADSKIRRAQRVDDITRDFESMIGELVGSLSSSSTELEAAANTLTTTAEATGRNSGEAAVASQEVSINVQSVASATEEITFSVREIGRQVQEASRVAGDAVKQAEKTNTSIAELSQAASRIGDVVKLITAVAEQTNLLALNATIEAARAGNAGRGFAVVATEVKALAEQTAKATDEIGNQIAGMQAATRDSVAAIREIGSTITLISEISSTITAAVEQQGAATQEISRNIQSAARRSNEVATSITDVSRGASDTGSASSQVLSSAQMLSTESTRLKTEVQNFLLTVRAA